MISAAVPPPHSCAPRGLPTSRDLLPPIDLPDLANAVSTIVEAIADSASATTAIADSAAASSTSTVALVYTAFFPFGCVAVVPISINIF